MKRPRRDPGRSAKHRLRTEVNFGCPVRYADGSGCGCPILTYHHFDPPWAGTYVHNPDGMIALCPRHHSQADGGAWTVAQLRAMKREPYVDDTVKVQWPWQCEGLVAKIGSSLIVGSGSPLRLRGRPVLMFRPGRIESLDASTVFFDSEIRDQAGEVWLRIDDGWFDLRLRGTTDLVFTPQTKSFKAAHGDSTFLELSYKRMPMERLMEWCTAFFDKPEALDRLPETIEKLGALDSSGHVPIMEFEGHFRTPEFDVAIKGNDAVCESFMPGLRETFRVPTAIMDAERRTVITDGRTKKELLSFG